MNLKKVISLLFISLFTTTSVIFAANNNRNVYSVYSDNFNGVHTYDYEYNPVVPEDDGDGIKFDVWEETMSSATMDSSANIPIPEGKNFIRYFWGSKNWVGCAYARKKNVSDIATINMNNYSNSNGGKIKFWARSDNSIYAAQCQVGFQYNNGADDKWLGYLTGISTTWQEFSFDIPSDVNLQNVTILFMMRNNTTQTITKQPGEAFLDLDNIRWVKGNGAASLSVVRKNVSDNAVTTDPISFSSNTFGQGWVVADQYLELDIDGEFSSDNWEIRVYSSATEEEQAGLYNATINDKLPMAWKISCSTLPYVYTDYNNQVPFTNINTLEIGEKWSPDGTELYGLYDKGKDDLVGNVQDWFPWFFIQKNGNKSTNSLIITKEGCHTFNNTPEGHSEPNEYFDTPDSAHMVNTFERKPKLFLACDTKDAKAVKYEASLIINLSYE